MLRTISIGVGFWHSYPRWKPARIFIGNPLRVPLLQKLDQVVTDLGFTAYTGQGFMLNMTLFTLSLMIGTAGPPHVIIRFFTVPKVADARWSAGWALIFIALPYLTAPAVGAMARLNIIDTIFPQGPHSQAVLYEERPDWMRNWEVTGLLKLQDKNGDGRIQYYNDKSQAFSAEASQNAAGPVTSSKSIMIFWCLPTRRSPNFRVGSSL
ncbi:hypothetical protein [Metarhizobium album]|uniref:hypothetical protein n=1 Tax=Metarhizobium album TaxID=2182425 RepID=UPI001FDEA6FB|nr:hypothetical protein [Rhizobium album]